MSVPNIVSCSPRHTLRDVVSLLFLRVLIMYALCEREQAAECLSVYTGSSITSPSNTEREACSHAHADHKEA